jgi:hypothetical protein
VKELQHLHEAPCSSMETADFDQLSLATWSLRSGEWHSWTQCSLKALCAPWQQRFRPRESLGLRRVVRKRRSERLNSNRVAQGGTGLVRVAACAFLWLVVHPNHSPKKLFAAGYNPVLPCVRPEEREFSFQRISTRHQTCSLESGNSRRPAFRPSGMKKTGRVSAHRSVAKP